MTNATATADRPTTAPAVDPLVALLAPYHGVALARPRPLDKPVLHRRLLAPRLLAALTADN